MRGVVRGWRRIKQSDEKEFERWRLGNSTSVNGLSSFRHGALSADVDSRSHAVMASLGSCFLSPNGTYAIHPYILTTYHPAMPTFHPSIDHIKSVHLSPLARDGYVHLNFFATFDRQDLSSDLAPEHGRWEIWTDIPFFDSKGNPPAYPGEWRSQQFTPFKTFSDELNGHAASTDRGSGLTLKPVSLPEPAKLLTTLHLVLVIPAEANRSYSYTFRYVYPDGQINWQSGVGGNGIVNLKEADTSPDQAKIRSGSNWPPVHNAFEDCDSWDWRGIGVTLQQSGERYVLTDSEPKSGF